MAIANSYPMGTVKSTDLLLGTSVPVVGTDEQATTRNFSVGELLSLGFTPNIVTQTFTITAKALDNLGNTSVVLQALAGGSITGEYVQLIGASVFGSGGALGSSMAWDAAGATITWTSSNVSSYNRIIIPQNQLPVGNGTTAPPYNIAALDGTWRRGGDILISTAADPVITGDVTGTTLTINLTYRSFPQTQ